MPSFSNRSASRLATCNLRLQSIFNGIIEWYDCTVLTGHRTIEDQEAEFAAGRSKVRRGKHNNTPSDAIDVAPYPIPEAWGEIPIPGELTREQRAAIGKRIKTLARFYHFAGFAQGFAAAQGIELRSGADWDGDRIFTDQGFDDLVHLETVDSRGD